MATTQHEAPPVVEVILTNPDGSTIARAEALDGAAAMVAARTLAADHRERPTATYYSVGTTALFYIDGTLMFTLDERDLA